MNEADLQRISAYVDDELDEAESADLEARLESSEELRRALAVERAIKASLSRLPPVEPRADLEFRLRRRLRDETRPGRLRFWISLAAGLALAALWLRGTPQFVVLELAQDHRSCFSHAQLPASVWGSQAETIRAWFEERGTRVPLLPERVAEMSLVGARYCPLLGGSMVAHIYFAGEEHHLSVFLLERWVRFEDGYGAMAGETAVRLLHTSGATLGIVAQRPADVEAFRRALEAGRPGWFAGAWRRMVDGRKGRC